MGKKQPLPLMVLGKLYSYAQKNQTGLLFLILYTKINSKLIKDLNVKT